MSACRAGVEYLDDGRAGDGCCECEVRGHRCGCGVSVFGDWGLCI